jgi:hypothetical protein
VTIWKNWPDGMQLGAAIYNNIVDDFVIGEVLACALGESIG